MQPHGFMIPDNDDLRMALAAASIGGQAIEAGLGKEQEFRQKAVGDFVSAIDEAVDAAITGLLRQRCPSDRICSEELNPTGADAGGRLWIVDPLDGTSAFRFRVGMDLPSVLIALEVDGVTQVAVAYSPISGEIFYAVKGGGAFCNGERLSTVWAPATIGECWVDMNQYGDSRRKTLPFRMLRKRLRLHGGAALVTSFPPHSNAACWIGQGQRKLAVVIHDNDPDKVKQEIWDVAGQQLIAEEAGGVCVSLRGKRYDPRKPEPFMFAATSSLAGQVLGVLDRRQMGVLQVLDQFLPPPNWS